MSKGLKKIKQEPQPLSTREGMRLAELEGQIVQDFNIQWNPNPAAASRAPELQPVAGGAKK